MPQKNEIKRGRDTGVNPISYWNNFLLQWRMLRPFYTVPPMKRIADCKNISARLSFIKSLINMLWYHLKIFYLTGVLLHLPGKWHYRRLDSWRPWFSRPRVWCLWKGEFIYVFGFTRYIMLFRLAPKLDLTSTLTNWTTAAPTIVNDTLVILEISTQGFVLLYSNTPKNYFPKIYLSTIFQKLIKIDTLLFKTIQNIARKICACNKTQRFNSGICENVSVKLNYNSLGRWLCPNWHQGLKSVIEWTQ